MRAIRTQTDEKGDQYSERTGIDTTGERDPVRHELTNEADINQILKRFGVGFQSRTPEYGTSVNYDMNLQTALEAVDLAKVTYDDMPKALRAKYPNWLSFLSALEAGRIRIQNVRSELKNVPPPEPHPKV